MAMHHDGGNYHRLHQEAGLTERMAVLQRQPVWFRGLSLLPRQPVICGG
jgi:hypothetical protein